MRIAICDDKMILHEELKKNLDKYSINRNVIINCDDYSNGFDLLQSNIEYDIIFMDYQMDGIDGLETSRQIRKNKIDTAIIFLTSYPNIVFDTFEVNTYRFLVKPINYEKLSSALDDFLASQDDSNFILIKSDELNKRINIDDILYPHYRR